MRNHLIGFLAGLAVAGVVGCTDFEADVATKYRPGACTGSELALLEQRITNRLALAERRNAERLERIEANQTALMLRFGFRPQGGK